MNAARFSGQSSQTAGSSRSSARLSRWVMRKTSGRETFEPGPLLLDALERRPGELDRQRGELDEAARRAGLLQRADVVAGDPEVRRARAKTSAFGTSAGR